ncbi:MAG TPA: hypothetical protein PLJ27_24850 [Polyangiaceae bacterium]|jgi:hypothetical protein|nr:MAG: hypothetical protein BWY17_04217 [Deltaproteobacteria bacterium ADurb.Bin207]HNS97854.1 hypothetical protein [Polyangiaceae bacterium]HNZ22813.1 hypothetical protein [Polyangiaceae bacterium]HOD24764.1 hypothetical protein [Polyangiaceae bacterium]HOE47711.1 hypothetical protein [Polyangiaceae bacterium]
MNSRSVHVRNSRLLRAAPPLAVAKIRSHDLWAGFSPHQFGHGPWAGVA